MKYFYSFIFVGLICAIASIIYDNSKLTIGHITSLFVVVGSILAFLGIYSELEDMVGFGANLPITSFGNALYSSAYEGFKETGVLGLLMGMLKSTSGGITATILFSFIISLIARPKS